MKIFVTGGAGFVGRNLAASLTKNSHEVTLFDNLSNSSETDIKPLLDKVNFVKGDITNYDDVSNNIKNSDIVIHLASNINVQESFSNPNLTKHVNVEGTKNLLKACVNNNITNIIAASTAAVYGDCNDVKIHLSEDSITKPISPYGESKLEMENIVREYSEKNDINAIILRFFNIYGMGQSPEYAGVITKFLEKIKENRSIEIYGDGNQTRDFVSISDVVNVINNTFSKMKEKRGTIYNIASGNAVSINDLAKLMMSIFGKNLKINHHPAKKGDIRFSQADIFLAKKELGYIPKISLEDGIKELI